MADLNRDLNEMHKRFSKIKDDLREFLEDYDSLFRNINRTFINERQASGTTAGLEDFYRLIQVIRRNRDVIGSLVRGCNGMRPVDKFRFVEEDVPEDLIRKPKRAAETKEETPAALMDVQGDGEAAIEEESEELV